VVRVSQQQFHGTSVRELTGRASPVERQSRPCTNVQSVDITAPRGIALSVGYTTGSLGARVGTLIVTACVQGLMQPSKMN
jgi:hypothetical protein